MIINICVKILIVYGRKKSDNMFDYAVFFTSHMHRLLSKKKIKKQRERAKKKVLAPRLVNRF